MCMTLHYGASVIYGLHILENNILDITILKNDIIFLILNYHNISLSSSLFAMNHYSLYFLPLYLLLKLNLPSS